MMKDSTKVKGPSKVLDLKCIVVSTTCIIVVLLLIFRSNYYSSSFVDALTASGMSTDDTLVLKASTIKEAAPDCTKSSCNKIPTSLAHALLHYTTSKITPQQTFQEISVSARVLEQKSPCNFLVFGLGHDSLMWNALNFGGRTVFLDEDEVWIKKIIGQFPMLESYKVTYKTKLSQSNELMEHFKTTPACKNVTDPRNSTCQLALKELPIEVYETKWDLIMVDAPTGFSKDTPGRMTAIYTAGLLARNREDGVTDVFVHDVDRPVEDRFSMAFFCEGYLMKQQGRIRHFTIPSYRDGFARTFCPVLGHV